MSNQGYSERASICKRNNIKLRDTAAYYQPKLLIAVGRTLKQ